MATVEYTAVAGDYLVKIAQAHGTTWQAIWKHPKNADHRRRRKSPDVLYVGDILHIPTSALPTPTSEPPGPPSSPPPSPPPPGSDWPYPRIEDRPSEGPTWQCPGGNCECHPPQEDAERIAHEIVFCDHRGRRMPHAWCRVVENGRLLNPHQPKARVDGTVAVDVLPTTKTLLVQWAPETAPAKAHLPFEKVYHLDVGQSTDEGVASRLANLGFCAEGTLFDNVCAFERAYQLGITGDATRVEPVLIDFHDEGLLPPVPPPVGEPQPTPPARPPPAPGPGAAPGVAPGGTVAATQLLTVTLRLSTQYFLTEDDFEKTGAAWPGKVPSHAYDKGRMLVELGGTSKQELKNDPSKKWRWPGRASLPIKDALVTFTVSKGASFIETVRHEKRTGWSGQVTFSNVEMNFEDFPIGPAANAFISVEPPSGLRAPGPAGPNWPRGAIKKDALYRGFAIALHFEADGVLRADRVELFNVSRPAHAKLVSSLPIKATSKGFVIDVDWRPDWVRGKSRARTITSRLKLLGLPDAASNTVAEPLLVLHETGNQNVHSGTINSFFHRTKVFNDRGKEVITSAHYVVDLDGHAVKMVDESEVAHHAAPSVWQGRNATNESSVGIEIVHTNVSLGGRGKAVGEDDSRHCRRFPDEQVETVRRLCEELVKKYAI